MLLTQATCSSWDNSGIEAMQVHVALVLPLFIVGLRINSPLPFSAGSFAGHSSAALPESH
jgi:hypothetical protein